MTKVTNIRKIGADKAVIRLRPDIRFHYIAGQYVELTFDGQESRFYSIANAPPANDDFQVHDIEVHIKNNGKGGAATYAINSLSVGDSVRMRGPFGESVWRPSATRPLLLVAGGLGISPLKAVAEDAVKNNHARIALYWGVATEDDRYYVHEELEKLSSANPNLRYESIIGTPVSEYVATAESNLKDFDIYLAGPPDMIRALAPKLIEHGARPESLYSDHAALLKAVLSGD